MKTLLSLSICLLLGALVLHEEPFAALADPPKTDDTQIPVTITAGHDTDPRDHGRPVILIAAALKVPDEVFRETFTHVKPAANGQHPEPDQVRKNKEALLKGLAPHGVTNDRLDEVSNYYRYNNRNGEVWRNTPAEAIATIKDGKVISIKITNPGAGYTSAPTLIIKGFETTQLKATLNYSTDFKTNGSITEIVVNPSTKP